MSSTKSRDGPKGGGGGGGANKTTTKSASNNKSDLKTDKLDLNPKITATAEQMQIARIIDTHRVEDPELQKKIKQVMDITRSTEDEACKALHSREYDIEQAITLLVEEGGSQTEWVEASRKKKVKTPGQKAEAKERAAGGKEGGSEARSGGSIRDRDSRRERTDSERKDSEYNQDGSGSYDSRGRGGGTRGFGRGSRGRGGGRGGGTYRIDNKENDESNGGPRSGNGFGGRYSNGPGRGGRGGRESGSRGRGGSGGVRDRDRDGTRTFASRARGPREGDFGHHPIDVWENSQADAPTETLKVEKWDEFPSAEDWDNEEYTGSLAESKVFTPSTQVTTATTATGMADANNLSGGMLPESTAGKDGGGAPNHIGPSSDLMSLFDNATGAGKTKANSFGTGETGGGGSGNMGVVVAGQSIDLSMLLQQKPPQQNSSSSGSEVVNSGHVHSHSVGGGLNQGIQLQQSYSNATQHGQGNNGQPLPPRNKGTTRPAAAPRGAPTMPKMPSSWGVQMPDDPSLGTLGALFANMEFGPSGSSGIPSSGVEMPDDSSVATLDVQFGGMEFGPAGSAFNSVTQQQQQHGVQQAGGDMMYSNSVSGGGQQTSQSIDYTISSAAGDKDGLGKSGQGQSNAPTSASPFQQQGQRNSQQQLVTGDSLNNSKTVPISPNIDTHHNHSSTGSKSSGGSQQQQSQQHGQQHASYVNSANTSGSAFVSYANKGAPGFPPVTQNTAAYGAMPQGLAYGSPAILTQPPPQTYHNMGSMSSYGAQPLVAGVQHSQVPSHTIPSQSLNQGVSSTAPYGVVPQNPYNPHSIPGSAPTYMYGSNQYGNYGHGQKAPMVSTTTGQNVQLATGKDSGVDSSSMSTTAASAANIGTGSTNTSSASSTPNSKISGSGAGNATGTTSNLGSSTTGAPSKINTSGVGTAGSGGAGIPPGMVLHPQYILNQNGVPLYGFQAPMYGYDENVQFLPRIPHPMTNYYDPSGAGYPASGVPGSGRDANSLQTYAPGNENRFARSDSSTASPVPSNLSGQATQAMYNPALPAGGYYYVGNNVLHPGAFPYGPPQMYPAAPIPTPTNQSSGAHHGGLTNQYQTKGMYGSNYMYDNSGQQLPNVTEFVSKQPYSSGTGGVGGGAGSGTGKSSTGSSVNNSQTTDLNSSLYKGHPNKLTTYDKSPYTGNTGTMYNNQMGQQGNSMGGAGGMGYGGQIYLPAQPVLQQPPLLLQDGSTGQRQGGGQPKPGKQQFGGNQQYWPN